MQAIDFEESNVVYKAPGCYDLPAMRYTDNSGTKHVVSCWKPTAEELADLQAGKSVYLDIIGGQPPVSLYTGDIPENIPFDVIETSEKPND